MKLDMKLARVFAAMLPLAACGDDGETADTNEGTSTGGGSTTSMTTNEAGSSTNAATTNATTDVSTTAADTGTTDPSSSTSTADSSSEDSGSTSSGGVEGATVSGAVNTSLDSGDLQGDLYVGLLASCAQEGERIGSAFLENVDLAAGPVTFTVPGMPDGTYYVTGFLDANENSDMNDPGPDGGDPVGAELTGPACVEVMVVNGEDVVAGEALVLNLRL